MSILIDGTSGITPLAFSSNLQFTSTGQRITGDFSTSTVANRVLFQTSTTNGNTLVTAIPNGTGTQARFDVNTSASDPGNASTGAMVGIQGSDIRFQSAITGTGTYLPMTFYTGGSERMRIDSSGNVGIGTSSPAKRLDVIGTGDTQFRVGSSAATSHDIGRVNSNGLLQFYGNQSGANGYIFGGADGERMRIDTSGNVGINAASLGSKIFAAQGLAQSPSVSGNMTTGFCFGSGTAGEALNIGTDADGVWYNSAYGNNAGVPRIHRWLTGGSERMRIDSSGNVGIGNTNPASLGKFVVSGAVQSGSVYNSAVFPMQ